MQRLYRFTALTRGADLSPSVPPDLTAHLEVHRYPFEETIGHQWTFPEEAFPLIPRVRTWLAGAAAEAVYEEGIRVYDEADSRAAPLVRLTGGRQTDIEVRAAEGIDAKRCPECRLAVTRVGGSPSLRLNLRGGVGPHFFSVTRPNLYVASAEFYEALAAAGLAEGLATIPVQIGRGQAGHYLGLYAATDLGPPAAPYGMTGERCPVCGQPFTRPFGGGAAGRGQPRYRFYLIFDRPAASAHWFWTPWYGQTRLLLTGAARDWLLGPGATFLQASQFNFYAHGWAPDEIDQAFLDPRYQA